MAKASADYWKYRMEHAQAKRSGERRKLRDLAKHWRKEAAGFHAMGKRMCREMNPAGHEYMQTAAAFRACATQLESHLFQTRR